MSQRGVRKRPFEQAKPNFDESDSDESPKNVKRKKVEDQDVSPAKPGVKQAKKKPRNFV